MSDRRKWYWAMGIIGGSLVLALVVWAIVAATDDDDDDDGGEETPQVTGTAVTETPTAEPGETPTEAEPTEPVETLPPPETGGFEDAFPDLDDLDKPIEMVEVPGQDWFLVALQEGTIVGFPKDSGASEVTEALSIEVETGDEEEGLLGMALDPDFESNGYVFLHYSVDGEDMGRVSRFTATGEGEDLTIDPDTELIILEIPQPYDNHNGGKLAFGPEGLLYLGLGDGGSAGDPDGNGQDVTENLLATIVRIDVTGSTEQAPYAIPPDNPFDGSDGLPEIWAYGLRNPWRFSFDSETGLLWVGDVGQDSLEEINIIEGGGNYGWNIMEGTACFEADDCDREGLILPVATYNHDDGRCSVTGGHVYRGSEVPQAVGYYFYGDNCTGTIWALDALAAAAGNAPEPVLLLEEGPDIASFAEDSDGELYILSFDGRIYKMTAP